MENISKTQPLPRREIYYYRQRQKNRVFADICAFFAEEAAKGGISKRIIADRIACDPALITRWLSAPSNLTLDTISDLLLALGAEMDCRIVSFADRPRGNAIHPFIASLSKNASKTTKPFVKKEQKISVQLDATTYSTGEVRILEPA
jgi:hypothetical protein